MLLNGYLLTEDSTYENARSPQDEHQMHPLPAGQETLGIVRWMPGSEDLP